MARIRWSHAEGTLGVLATAGAVTLSSPEFVDRLPEVVGGDVAAITLDPGREFGEPEIVYVSEHFDEAGTVTVQRARETDTGSGPAREHPVGTRWVHAPTPADFASASGVDVNGATAGQPIVVNGAVDDVEPGTIEGGDATTTDPVFQIRRDTAANWTSEDPTLDDGEFALDTTNRVVKLGDGLTAWSSLDPIGEAAGGGAIGADVVDLTGETAGTVPVDLSSISSEVAVAVVLLPAGAANESTVTFPDGDSRGPLGILWNTNGEDLEVTHPGGVYDVPGSGPAGVHVFAPTGDTSSDWDLAVDPLADPEAGGAAGVFELDLTSGSPGAVAVDLSATPPTAATAVVFLPTGDCVVTVTPPSAADRGPLDVVLAGSGLISVTEPLTGGTYPLVDLVVPSIRYIPVTGAYEDPPILYPESLLRSVSDRAPGNYSISAPTTQQIGLSSVEMFSLDDTVTFAANPGAPATVTHVYTQGSGAPYTPAYSVTVIWADGAPSWSTVDGKTDAVRYTRLSPEGGMWMGEVIGLDITP